MMAAGGPSLRRRVSPTLTKHDTHDQQSISTSIPRAASERRPSILSTIIANIVTLYELSFLVTSYISQPLDFIDIYLLPTFIAMGFFTSGNPFNPKTSIPPLTNKVILVTGGNAGLGKEAILQLARHGPSKIYLAARSPDKARAAINSINNQLTVPTEIEHLPLDLSDLASIKAAADHVKASSSRLDILMLNAGIMATPPARTAQGFDNQMGVNHVGHFYLTTQLLPLLNRTASMGGDVRVVALASDAYNLAPSSLDTIFSTDRLVATSPWSRYGASKAANIMFTAELARRYPALTAVSLHPGIIMTELHAPGQESWTAMGWFLKVMSPLIAQDVPHGAYTQLWAATADKEGVKSGAYHTPVGKAKQNKWTKDREAGRRCWEWTEKEIEKAGF